MSFSQFLSILRARWRSAMTVFVVTVVVAAAITLAMPPKYTAETAVVIDVKSPDPIAGMVLGAMTNPSYMATQVDLLQSSRVARLVVQNLKLAENTELRNQWVAATQGQGSFDAWVGDLLKRNLLVQPPRESNIIGVSYTGRDPQFAAAMANAFAQAYVQTAVDLRTAPAKQYNTFFENQTRDLRKQLEAAQERLSKYQKEHGILVNDERLDVENQRLADLSSQLVAVQGVSAESRSRSTQGGGSAADRLQDSINNPVVGGLRADLARQRAKLQQISANLGPAHPQVVELEANIQELQHRLDAEVARIGASVRLSDSINTSRESQIRSALEAQRGKVAHMRAEREEVSLLMKDVDSAQRAYEAVYQRQTQSSMESQTNQTNVSVLAPATPPTSASSPKMTVNLGLAALVGLVLAIGLAVLYELLDRRLRSHEDVLGLLDLPVLGELPRPLRVERSGRGQSMVLPSHMLGRRLSSPSR